MGERLGVLGGTFDPPHVGHAIVAQDVLEALELDRLLVVPSGRPPHREPVFPARYRHDWVQAVFSGAERIEVSDIELRRPGPSFTVDTLAQVRAEANPARLFCILGSDQFRLIHTWHEFRRLSELSEIVVMCRDGCDPEPGAAEIPHRLVRVTRVDVSSTRVRERLRAGQSIRHLVPECIAEAVSSSWRALSGNGGTIPGAASISERHLPDPDPAWSGESEQDFPEADARFSN
ncbi:MAG: nicotinate (nicotinamide) nucleotide adenylyltransferase [Gemmatimonadota bacterium]